MSFLLVVLKACHLHHMLFATRDGDKKLVVIWFVRAFDADADGRWTYSDFKRYLEAVGRPGEFEPVVLDSAEAFRCYCDDLFGTDERGLLAFEHFLAYREDVEHTAPVEADVLACGLSAAPAALGGDGWATAGRR